MSRRCLSRLEVLRAAYDYYDDGGIEMTASDLAWRLKASDSAARRWAKRLVALGYMEQDACQVTGAFKVSTAIEYRLTGKGIALVEGASVDLEAVAKPAREEVAEAQDRAPQGR